MAISKEDVLDALRNVIDPDLGRDLVSLNMIEDIQIDGKKCLLHGESDYPCMPDES